MILCLNQHPAPASGRKPLSVVASGIPRDSYSWVLSWFISVVVIYLLIYWFPPMIDEHLTTPILSCHPATLLSCSDSLVSVSGYRDIGVYRFACVCVTRVKLLQPCLTLCDPVDCSPPGSSVHETLLAITLEWGAMPSSRGSFPSRDRTSISHVSCTGRQVLYQ